MLYLLKMNYDAQPTLDSLLVLAAFACLLFVLLAWAMSRAIRREQRELKDWTEAARIKEHSYPTKSE